MKIHEERLLREAVATGHDRSRPRRKRKVKITDPDPKRVGNRSGRTDELRNLPRFSSCCLPGPLAPFVLLHRLRGCQRLRSQRIYFSNSLCLFLPFRVFSLCVRYTTHCHQQCVSAHFANSASHITDSSRGVMTPSLTPARPGHQRLLDGLL